MSRSASDSKVSEKAGTPSALQPTTTTFIVGSKKRPQPGDAFQESPSPRNDKKYKLSEVEIETIQSLALMMDAIDLGDRSLGSAIASKVA